MTGTEGFVRYEIHFGKGMGTGGVVELHWDNPWVGNNEYSETVPLPGYKAPRSGGEGNNTTVYWTFDLTSKTGDGIPDDWKRNGITIDGNLIDLPKMGATVDKPDLFIQVDWMQDFGATTAHTHKLSNDAIRKVVKAFADAPFKSRSGSTGINLHIDAGSDSLLDINTNTTWGALSKARQVTEVAQLGTGTINAYRWNAKNPDTGATDPGTFFDGIKSESGGFQSTGRAAIFRYCVMGHGISNLSNSGIARGIPGSDFILSLAATCGLTPTTDQQAHTFMHELGHNLGLFHGGGEDINWKPNYVSIMSYAFQWPGLTRGTTSNICDFSNVALDVLDENHLDETKGVGAAAANVTITKYDPVSGTRVFVADGSQPIDWDGNSLTTLTDYPLDVTQDSDGLTVLQPYNDWENLRLRGGAIGAGSAYEAPKVTVVNEITPEDMENVLPMDTTPPTTTAVVSPPPNGAGWNNEAVTVTLNTTDDISGVAGTQYNVDGFGVSTYTGPTTFTMEGIHSMEYYSVDRSQNREVPKQLSWRVDQTPPEALITYDAEGHQIIVSGRDSLSGIADDSPIQPASVKAAEWTMFGSDCAEDRVYRVFDRAGNRLELSMRVRCERDEFEFSVTGLRYKDAKEAKRPERNTVVYRRLRGRACGCGRGSLLGVLQRVSLGEGEKRRSVQWSWNALCGATEGREWSGCCCEGKKGEGKGNGKEKGEKEGKAKKYDEKEHDERNHEKARTEIDRQERPCNHDAYNAKDCEVIQACGTKVLGLATEKGLLKLEK